MPRQQTYGKRSKTAYTAVSLSSPDQPSTKPLSSHSAEKTPIKANQSRKRVASPQGREASDSGVLRERSHNCMTKPPKVVSCGDKKSNKLETQSISQPKDDIPARGPTKLLFNDNDDGYVVVFGDDPNGVHSLSTAASSIPSPQQRRRPKKTVKSSKECTPEAMVKQSDTIISTSSKRRERETVKHQAGNVYTEYCEALLSLSQHPLTCFNAWSSQLSDHFDVVKIAEASFGEVYRLALREAIPNFSKADESVFKIIPLRLADKMLPSDKRKRAAAMKRAEFMSKPHDVANEVRLLQRMSAIPGFTNFRDIRIVQGAPPEAFVAAYKAWNTAQKSKKKDPSHWPDPSKKSSYTEDQLWAVIEMQDAGTDLEQLVESGICTSVWCVWDAFWQTVLSLAKGEESAEFEHRDLHLGNICVRSPDPNSLSVIDTKRKLNFTSLETTIIDYTISRCVMPNSETAFTDLSLDAALFEGDSTEEYQYDIYRYMRSALFLDEALADFHSRQDDVSANGRTWEQYHPQTNLVWLHLVLYKLLEQLTWPSSMKMPSRKTKKEEYRQWKRANDLEHVLLKVQDLLDPEVIGWNGIQSAGDLVVFALQEEWLDVEDVVGHGMGDESALVSQLEGLEL